MTFRVHARSLVLLLSVLVLVPILVLAFAPAAHATLSATLERQKILEGDTVQFRLDYDAQTQETPDVTPLEKDFEILGQTSGSKVNIVNGVVDARTNWTLTLSPKRTGTLTVPALTFQGESSQELTLEVTPASTRGNGTSRPLIFIETTIEPKDPYVQSQLIYTMRLFHSVQLIKGSLSEPRSDGIQIRRLGKDSKFSMKHHGQRYRVIERRYAVFPQSSGRLVLAPPVLDVRVPQTRQRRSLDPFGFFGSDPAPDPFGTASSSTRRLRVRGKKNAVTVHPRPRQATGPAWLPAELVQLGERWQPATPRVQVGEPLTRTITIRAQGLTGEHLPDLKFGSVDGFKVYPDPSQSETKDLRTGVEGVKHRRFAFMPVRPGRLTIPGVRLPWWDTTADRERVAFLPPQTVLVTSTPGRAPSAGTTAGTPATAGTPSDAGTTTGPKAGRNSIAAANGRNPGTGSGKATAGDPSLQPGASGSAGSATPNAAAGGVRPWGGQPTSGAAPMSAGAPTGSSMGTTAPSGKTDLSSWFGMDLWPWLSLALGVLWLGTAAGWWRDRRLVGEQSWPDPAATRRPGNPRAKAAAARRRFEAACQGHNPQEIRQTLLDWAKAHWPDAPPAGLDDLAGRLNDQATRQALANLDATLYGQAAPTWTPQSLSRSLRNLPPASPPASSTRTGSGLPELYPGQK